MGKEADLSQPAKAPTHIGDHGGATTPFFQDTGRVLGRRGGKSRFPSPHHCSTTNTINQGKGAGGDLGGGWGRGVPCGSGSQTTGKPSSGGSLPQSQESDTNSGCRRKEGRAWGWQLALPSRCCSFQDQHVSRLTFAKATKDLLGFLAPSGAAQDQPPQRCRLLALLIAPSSGGSHLRVPHGSSLLCLNQVPLSSISFLSSRQ